MKDFRMITKHWWLLLPLVVVLAVLLSFLPRQTTLIGQDQASIQPVKVVATFPHDPNAFSQGLVVEGDRVLEGTGKYGGSVLRSYDLRTGTVDKQVELHPNYFGEGITVLGNRIYQLTWKSRVCIVYDKESLEPIGKLNYTGEGWGLTDDEKQLYLSDGSSTIRVLDPNNFQVIRRITVKYGRKRQEKLNELEFVNGEIYANIWYSDQIVRIDPKDGAVKGWLDCSQIYPAAQRANVEHVFNGIAYDPKSNRLFVTGKNWPNLFEITTDSK